MVLGGPGAGEMRTSKKVQPRTRIRNHMRGRIGTILATSSRFLRRRCPRTQRPHMKTRSFATALIILAAAPALLHSQAPSGASTVSTPPARRTVVTVNPFLIVAAFLTGDVETRIAPAVTLGAGGTLAGDEDFDFYRAFDAKIRYYPNEKALQGLSVAATFGVVTGQNDAFDGIGNSASTRSTRGTFGTDLSYQWLIGPKHRFVAVTGVGFKRLFNNSANSEFLDIDYLPTARVNIGFAF